MVDVVVLVGTGSLGQAIARRIGAGKKVLLADLRPENAESAAKTLSDAGFDVAVGQVNVAERASVEALVDVATGLGNVTSLIQAAGVSPSQASIDVILKVDLYGTALLLDRFGEVMAPGGAGLVISSQSGHRLGALPEEQTQALAVTPIEKLLDLPFLQPEVIKDTLHAYQLSKRGNVLRVVSEAVRWGRRGARVNSISPGIIITPLANDELKGPRGDGYRKMIASSVAKRAGTPDEVATVASLLMGPDGAFITGSDVLIDGGTSATYWFGDALPD